MSQSMAMVMSSRSAQPHLHVTTLLSWAHLIKWFTSTSRVGISGTTAKSRKRKFVPSSHPGRFTLVASSQKSKTKVGTLACFDFFVKE